MSLMNAPLHRAVPPADTPGELIYHIRRGQQLCITANLAANASDGSMLLKKYKIAL
jgi:hypothetical protein